jgi:hypothetical protein
VVASNKMKMGKHDKCGARAAGGEFGFDGASQGPKILSLPPAPSPAMHHPSSACIGFVRLGHAAVLPCPTTVASMLVIFGNRPHVHVHTSLLGRGKRMWPTEPSRAF